MSARRLTPLVVAMALLTGAAGVARATTGDTTGFPPPKVVVPVASAAPFEGRYVLTAVGKGADVRSGEMKVDFSEGSAGPQFLVGGLQLYEYNSAGQLETGLFSLYPFTNAPGGLTAPLLSQGLGQVTLGRLKLLTPRSEAELRGEISLHHNGPFAVVFKRLATGQSVNGGPSPATQLTETAQKPTAPGWGPSPSGYEGEYELTNAAPDPASEAAVLAPVILVAQGFGPGGAPVTGGSMKVSGGSAGSAEVTLEAGGEARSYYLTDLGWRGNQRLAKVHSDSRSGPVAGSFEGRQTGETLAGTLEADGARYDLTFLRRG
jgi:hypothetical protein